MVYKYHQGVIKERMSKISMLAIALLFTAAAGLGALAPASADAVCEETEGPGSMTANYINEVPRNAFDVTCDVGIYIDEDMSVRGAEVNGVTASAKSNQYGIYVSGADVDITRTSVTVEEDYPHRFASVSYRDGATGTLSNSEITGAHRVGVLVRDEGSSAEVKGNLIEGTGANSTGWAENGVQVDQGATANVVNNTIAGHWWDGESNWASSGLMILGDNAKVVNNNFMDNEFNLYLAGDNNTVKGNTVDSDVVSQSSYEFAAYGVLLNGSHNHIAGNRLATSNGAVGMYVYDGSTENKITGNRATGFDYPYYDAGSENMIRGFVAPME